jgi:hypothetical protein
MNEKGNRYAIAALKDKRAGLASEIIMLKRQLRHRKEALAHVDATLKLLDPSANPSAIPPKRRPKRVRLFRSGELGALILGALRKADGQPLGTAQIVDAIVRDGEMDEDARPSLMPRVRTNLAYLVRRAKVAKTGSGVTARWRLSHECSK